MPKRIRYFDGKLVVDVVAGNHHTLALTDSNELYAWGDGRYGQCGYGEFESTPIPQLVTLPQINQGVSSLISKLIQNSNSRIQ